MLFAGIYLLLNLAQDVVVERKMIKKGLMEYLEGVCVCVCECVCVCVPLYVCVCVGLSFVCVWLFV